MKLSWKFIGVVIAILVVVLSLRGWSLAVEKRDAILADARERALTVLSFGEACRQYARETLSPAVRKHAKPLIFEADSATFVARGTFHYFRQKQPAYSFREAALNPLNPENRADAGEAELIERFRADVTLKELSGFRHTPDGEVFYVARPIVVQRVCLQCHASPETAPTELVERYGDKSGYGWKEGEINSAIMVTVPAKDIYQEQHAVFWPVLGLFLGIGALLTAGLWLLFHFLVHGRLRRLKALMAEVAAHPLTEKRLTDRGGDELGEVAQAFNQMADGLRGAHLLLEERVAERTAELACSNAELGQFAYIASHDLQEPLRKVLAFGDMLAAKHGETLGEEGKDFLQRMQGASRRMQDLINDLLTLSRVTTKANPFERVDLREVARQVIADLEIRIRDAGAQIELTALPTIEADPTQMRQLLQNLIGNALKFKRPDVPPVVCIKGRTLEGSVPGWEIEVSDNGIGFDDKYAERIFLPFQRLHGASAYEGSGMGLAICRKIVERHGGSIRASGVPGEGATFRVSLPARRGRPAKEQP